MKAIILVGGQGTRLRPLTTNTPKAMVPIANKPFMEHVFRHLKQYGIKDIVLAIGHLAQPIKDYFGDGSTFGINLSYSLEDTPLNTAGAVKNAQKYLDNESFMVLNGDIFTDLDLTDMIKHHRRNKATITIALTPVADPCSYGLVETGDKGEITRFLEKPSPDQITTNLINAGTYVLEAEVLEHIPADTNFSFEYQVFPPLLEKGASLYAYPSESYWIDIGKPHSYRNLNFDLLEGKISHYDFTRQLLTNPFGRNNIEPSAAISPPVVIGDNCHIGQNTRLNGPVVIGSGCQITEGVIIENSIIWHNTVIEAGSVVKDSVIADNCHIGTCCLVTDSLISDHVTISGKTSLPPQSRIKPHTTL
jgi:mannose-1-phosphate guanylyltransferase